MHNKDEHKEPTVSVVISTHNREHLLPRAIKSVLQQTYQDFELIVVDDGSKEPVEDIVKGFDDQRIRYIRHDRALGLPSGRNTGIKAAKGSFLAFLDDDDEWFAQRLERMVPKLKESPAEVGVVYCKCVSVYDHSRKEVIRPAPTLRGNVYEDCLRQVIVTSPCVLVKRECFERAGLFDENLGMGEDWDMWIRLAKYYEYDCVDEVLAKYHIHGASMTNDALDHAAGLEYVVKKHFSEIARYPKILASHYHMLGDFFRVAGKHKLAFDYMVKAIRLMPSFIFRKSTWGILVKSIMGICSKCETSGQESKENAS